MIINTESIKFNLIKVPETNEKFYLAYNDRLGEKGNAKIYEEIISSMVVSMLINPETRIFTAGVQMEEKEVNDLVKKIEKTGRKVDKMKVEDGGYALGIWTSKMN